MHDLEVNDDRSGVIDQFEELYGPNIKLKFDECTGKTTAILDVFKQGSELDVQRILHSVKTRRYVGPSYFHDAVVKEYYKDLDERGSEFLKRAYEIIEKYSSWGRTDDSLNMLESELNMLIEDTIRHREPPFIHVITFGSICEMVLERIANL